MNIGQLFHLQIMMFLIIGLGYLLRKRGLITPQGKKCLTDLVVEVFLPCNIIHSFCITMDAEVVSSCVQILLVSVALQVLCMVIAAFAYRRVPKEKRMCMQFGTVCSNAAFLGNAVAEGLYGSLGMLYASVYCIPQRIVMWSVGVSYFTESPSPKELMKKIVTHPCIIAVAAGLVIMLGQIPLPTFLSKTLSSLGGCTSPITMLYIGTILADAGGAKLITPATLGYSCVRLIIIPALTLLGCKAVGINETVAGVAVVLAAMPAGSITAMMASKYGGDEVFAGSCIVLTTLLSMALLPAWCAVIGWVM